MPRLGVDTGAGLSFSTTVGSERSSATATGGSAGGASDAAGDTAAGATETGSRGGSSDAVNRETAMRHSAAPTTTPNAKDQSSFGIGAREARGGGTGVERRGVSGRLAGRTTTDVRGAGVVAAASIGDGPSEKKSASGSITGAPPPCVPVELVLSVRSTCTANRLGNTHSRRLQTDNRRFWHRCWTAGCESQPGRVLS